MLDKEWLKGINSFQKFKNEFFDLLEECSSRFENEENKINVFYTSSKDQINYCETKKKECISFFDVNRVVYPIKVAKRNISYNLKDFEFTFHLLEMYFDKNFNTDNYEIESISSHADFLYLILKEIEQSIWIAFYNAKIEELRETKKEPDYYPFKKEDTFNLFESYMRMHVINPILDISYLFQRLKKLKCLYNITHYEFIDWLYDKEYISSNNYDAFIGNKGMNSLKNCKSEERELKFDNHFNSII